MVLKILLIRGSLVAFLYNQVAFLLLAVLVAGWVVGLGPLAADCIWLDFLALISWGVGIPIPLEHYDDLDPTGCNTIGNNNIYVYIYIYIYRHMYMGPTPKS